MADTDHAAAVAGKSIKVTIPLSPASRTPKLERSMSPIRRLRRAEMEAQDRRMAAAHEAGHLVVAWRYGLPMSATIWRRHPDDDTTSDTDSFWTGQTAFVQKRFDRLSVRRCRTIAAAGAAGAAIWSGRAVIDELELYGGASLTDLRLAGLTADDDPALLWHDAERAEALLAGPLRQHWIGAQRTLIEATRPGKPLLPARVRLLLGLDRSTARRCREAA